MVQKEQAKSQRVQDAAHRPSSGRSPRYRGSPGSHRLPLPSPPLSPLTAGRQRRGRAEPSRGRGYRARGRGQRAPPAPRRPRGEAARTHAHLAAAARDWRRGAGGGRGEAALRSLVGGGRRQSARLAAGGAEPEGGVGVGAVTTVNAR